MESSKLSGGTEECSSESGWTMYIASPIHQYNQEDYDNGDERNSRKRDKYLYNDNDDDDNEDGESDDSLASDASSGPGHQEVCTSIDRSHGKLQFKHAEKETTKLSSKEHHGQVKKKLYDTNIKAAKEDSGHKAKNRTDYACSRSTSRRKYKI